MNETYTRRFKRLASSLKVTLRVVSHIGTIIYEEDSTAINVSKTGMLLQTSHSIMPKSKLEIAIDISGTPVNLKCQCMYCREVDVESFESGIHIHKINKKGMESYRSFIKTLEAANNEMQSLRPETQDMTNVVTRISAEHKIINQ